MKIKEIALGLCLAIFLLVVSQSLAKEENVITLGKGWKFIKGDNPQWADPKFDDSNWRDIRPDKVWQVQYPDLEKYNGYAWYRIKFILPASLKKKVFFKEQLQFILGKIDDFDQTFLNGQFMGQNCITALPGDTTIMGSFPPQRTYYDRDRKYILNTNDPRIRWDKENILAIRVLDTGGVGGVYSQIPEIRMIQISDVLSLNIHQTPFAAEKGIISKSINVRNNQPSLDIQGKIEIVVESMNDSKPVFQKSWDMEVKRNSFYTQSYEFQGVINQPYKVDYTFTETKTKQSISANETTPYILTPKPGDSPRITGPKVFGARPGRPILFRLTSTGKKPITYSIKDLPLGTKLDEQKGVLTGSIDNPGEYDLHITAKNQQGQDSRILRLKIGDTIALTPPMGWNSWNVWGTSVNDEKVRNAMSSMISSGLGDHGWTYINIDDGWEAPERTSEGLIVPNEKFPDIKALSGYLHSNGFKFGIYSSPGPKTCAGYLGSFQHEGQDAQTWANWGVDYIKYDWCSYQNDLGETLEGYQKPYRVMQTELDKVNRDIVYSLCQYGMGNVWEWGADVGGNLWRTTGDIQDNWESLKNIGFNQGSHAPYAKPGHWNDPDMMIVGYVGWGPSIRPTRLSADEQYTHVSLWCLLSAPLLLGCDLTKLDDFTLNLLTNEEVLEIDQDSLGKQATPVYQKGDIEIWAKDLEDGSKAVGLFNLSDTDQKITLQLNDLKIQSPQTVRDLWRQKNLGVFDKSFETRVNSHGVVLVKVMK